MIAAVSLQIDVTVLVPIVLTVLGLVAVGALSVRRGRSQAQEQATETYKEAAEAWELRYRAQQEELAAQSRRIEAGESERDRLRAEIERMRTEIQGLRERPDYDALVATVDKLAQAVQSAVANEERIREHAHALTAIGGALNLKLDAVLRQMGIDIPAPQAP